MTADAAQPLDAASEVPTDADEGRLFCYRHPTRETWVRCGRCDRPICPKCAVQGPVGFRCRDCGRMKNDPLTTFRPSQLALALGIALVGGTVAGIVAGQVGFFSIVISFFAGRLIVEAEHRVIGFKHGPVMLAIVFGGILAGGALGFAWEYATYFSQIVPEGYETEFGPFLQQAATYALISAGAACVGAWYRLR